MNWITVNDRFQSGYRYGLDAPEGNHFPEGFKPELSPREMLELGVFGGVYLRDGRGEFPADWFANARFAAGARPDPAVNYFGRIAGQSLQEWQARGWIHPDDPRGWFQWFCRYWRGRRHVDDARQIARWRAFSRHAGQIRKACEPGDPFCRPRQRQALLQWAYDARIL